MNHSSGDIATTLQRVFGFDRFRDHQESIVRAVLDGRDTFVVMPTGGGKSLCYQLPAHILPGVCFVISPLISLMKDQVDAAEAIGLRAACLNSSQSTIERRAARRRLEAGELDLAYVSPERFAMPGFLDVVRAARPSFVAIDEAHCISEWGHDFRPDYLELSALVDELPEVPVTAFTATATRTVQRDIIDKLRLRQPHIVRASFNRPNLFYQVQSKTNAERQVLDFVRRRAGEPGIVYRTTRKAVDATAALLIEQGLRARPYHAGLDDESRAACQDAFNRDEIDVVVATIAFGMGIDKSNVRYVVHGDLPKSIEGYYQETGRAGRDGAAAHCLLLFGRGDVAKLRYFVDPIEDEEERRRALRCLNDMASYAGVLVCRRKQLLAYFDEEFDAVNCGACDVCTGDVEKVDATRAAQIVLSAIVRTGERFGIKHIVDVVTGADTQRVRDLGHDRIKTYGVGADQSKAYWRMIIDNLLGQEALAQSEGQYPVLQLRPPARKILFDGEPVFVVVHRETRQRRAASASDGPYDEALFQELRQLRKQLAHEQGVPPYVVFSDKTLYEMARALPASPSDLLAVNGVGEAKLARYGAEFLEVIAGHVGERAEPQPDS